MKLKILRFKNKHALIDIQSEELKGRYRVNVINNNGLFGVEYPPKLGVALNRFPKESKELVNELRYISRKA